MDTHLEQCNEGVGGLLLDGPPPSRGVMARTSASRARSRALQVVTRLRPITMGVTAAVGYRAVGGPDPGSPSPVSSIMLMIRRTQIDALAELARRRLAADARAHLRVAHPERWAAAAEEILGEWVERRLARGVRLGLVEEASLLRHLEVASRRGERFADSNDAVGVLHDLDALRRWPEPLALLERLHRASAET